MQSTVSRTDAATGVSSTGFVYLNCPGTAGKDHPWTAEACADLYKAGGDVDRLPGSDTAYCSNDSDPRHRERGRYLQGLPSPLGTQLRERLRAQARDRPGSRPRRCKRASDERSVG
ncbi:SSI family serine proteinase inhibitor [Streptomyces sp. NPDC055103]